LVPDHAPEAEQEVAFVEDQVSMEDPPLVTDVGLAASATVSVATVSVDAVSVDAVSVDSSSTALPPQAENVRASTRTSSKLLTHGMGLIPQ
jgi:uncharacterized Fe-S center protein